jgi:four helix bundle protein
MQQSYKDLQVWQKSMDLVEKIYGVTKQLPPEENYSLKLQLRRAAIAIPSNIAEGYRRQYKKEFSQFLSIAAGSASELETQLELAKRLYPRLDTQSAVLLLDEVAKMIAAFRRKI